MATEIRRIDVVSAFWMAIPLGAVSTFISAIPVLLDWIQGPGVSFGYLVVDLIVWMAIGGLTTAVVIAVLATVYNAVADQYRGVEVTLSK